MSGFRSYKEMKEKREEIRRQREFIGEEIQRSILTLGSQRESPWYKKVENWFFAGDIAFEIFKRFKR